MNHSAIIFDCDGVLVDSEKIYISVEREQLATIGLEYEFGEYQTRFVGLSYADYLQLLEADYAALDRGTFPNDFVTTLEAVCWQRFESELNAVDGVVGLLDHFTGQVAVASSSTVEGLHKKLVMTGLHPHFDPHVYSGELVAKGKPAPDLFLFAASQLGRTADQCLVIEDSVNGVRAALAAGMAVWGFTGGGHADEGLSQRLKSAGAHEVFSHFAEMQSRLNSAL
jgi:HAD superfamily hydrolase (TIGR01509 family)